MAEVLDDPSLRARLHAIDVEAYHRLGEVGEIGERTELVRGVIVDQLPKSPLQASIVGLLYRHLVEAVPGGWHVRSEQPLTLRDSEPEPDLAVVADPPERYFVEHPASARLVIEVCVSSEALDRLKLELYAEAGVAEYWLILTTERMIERHTEPGGSRYGRVERTRWSEPMPSTVFAGLSLPPPRLSANVEWRGSLL